jgi:hypothetical protein
MIKAGESAYRVFETDDGKKCNALILRSYLERSN